MATLALKDRVSLINSELAKSVRKLSLSKLRRLYKLKMIRFKKV